MGVLLLKNGGNPPFFCVFLVCDRRFGVFLSWCVWSGAVAGAGGVSLWLVVSFLCDVVCGADFRGIGCRLVFVSWAGGGVVECLWWCGRDGCRHRGRHGSRMRNKIFLWARSGVGGGAILSWWICGKHIII